ncbi:hypothetical protein E2C01_047115 [Portunus trituberculatus]|uniref:Uncharacterized protein n=1 Tax=Portunus trituberculatus TaxID=210409 RepID=A0A5B7G730_PORTR|nr:hypothetical protein [Portunus trituberculatus]
MPCAYIRLASLYYSCSGRSPLPRRPVQALGRSPSLEFQPGGRLACPVHRAAPSIERRRQRLRARDSRASIHDNSASVRDRTPGRVGMGRGGKRQEGGAAGGNGSSGVQDGRCSREGSEVR